MGFSRGTVCFEESEALLHVLDACFIRDDGGRG